MNATLPGRRMSVSDLQPSSALFWIAVTVPGMSISFSEEHPSKSRLPICVMFSGSETSCKAEQPVNKLMPIELICPGSRACFNDLHCPNAESPSVFTVSGTSTLSSPDM